MIVSVHQPQYLPWLGFFDKIDKSDCFVFLDNVQYKKREFQNRNKIRTKNGWIWLTVPVESKGKYTQKIKAVMLDNTCDWQKSHFKSIKTHYSHAKYFKDYIDFFEKLYAQKWLNLIDLNVHIIRFVLLDLKINKDIYFESELGVSGEKTQRILNICKKLKADTYLSGAGGKDYLDAEAFKKENVKLSFQDFKHPEYEQCYKPFVPFMSIIDLLLNQGKKSLSILRGQVNY